MKKICLESFPELLTRHDFWHTANDKKIPVKPCTEMLITGDRLSQCLTFERVAALVQRGMHPFAVYLHNEREQYITLDLDKARDAKTGRPLPWVLPLFAVLGITEDIYLNGVMSSKHPYIEVSWSGTGYHVLMKGTVPFGKRLWLVDGKDASGKDCPKIELLNCNCAITYTGNVLPGSGQAALPVEPLLDYLKVTYPDQHGEPVYIKKEDINRALGAAVPEWRGRSNQELTPEQVADMLDRINPDCGYDEWTRIGMAINSWDNGATGKELWSQWSEGGSQFGAGTQKEINTAWKSFKPGGSITIASVVKKAQDAGYQFQRPVVVQKAKQQSTSMIPVKVDQTTLAEKGDQKKNNQMESPPVLSVVPPSIPISDEAALKIIIKEGIDAVVTRYNPMFVHTLLRSKNVVMCLKKSGLYHQREWIPMAVPEFKQMMSHETPVLAGINQKKEPIYKNPASIWLGHEKASFCQDCVFRPTEERWINGQLNLYRGFAVKPTACQWDDQDVALWYQHLHRIVCQERKEVSRYVINWLAHMIQKPEQKPKTAIILKGQQGTGKGSLIEPILEIMGIHGAQLTRSNSVTGRFNAILENKIFLFADEAVFNNRQASNILKAMVSEKLNTTERKGFEQNIQQDFVRVMMAADDDHVIKVSGSERRYLFLQVSDQHIQDFDYFKKLKLAKRNGLPGKLLYLLQQHDISQFLPMAMPKTDLLTEEKLHDLKPEEQFIYEVLQKGCFSEGGWPARMDTLELQRYFRDWLEVRRMKFYGSLSVKLGNVLKKMRISSSKRRIGTHQFREYDLKELEYLRTNFVRYILNGSEVDW